MKKEALAQFGHENLILASFLLFFTCFVGVLFWVFRRKNKDYYKKVSQLPLKDQNGE